MGQERLWSSSKEAKISKLVFFVGPTIHHKCHHCHNLWHYDIVMLCYIQSLFVQPWQVAWQGEHKHRFEETAMAVIFLVESSQARFQKNEKKKNQNVILILLDTNLIENGTKTMYLTFYLINPMDFCIYLLIVNLMPFQTSWYRDNNRLGKLWNDPKSPVWNRFHPVFIYWDDGCCLKGTLFYF